MICVPFLRGDEVIGILHVFSDDSTHPLDEHDAETLQLLSVVVSAALARAAEAEARREAARALTRFRDLFDGASLGILRLDRAGVILEANPAVETMLGERDEALVGRRLADHLVGEHGALVDIQVAETVASDHGAFELEVQTQSRSGALSWCQLRAVVDHSEATPHVTVMVEDVSERRYAQAALTRQLAVNEHQALHDPLTGLPNRRLFIESIGQAIRSAKRRGSRMAVLVMDLDRFKEVNDFLGHAAGDELLVTVGERIRGIVREADTVARLGGDEYGLMLPEIDTAEGVRPVLERIRLALERPISVNTLPLSVEASIGVAVYPEHGTETQLLLQRADAAMYEAKRESSGACFYEGTANVTDVTRLTLVGELRRAMADGELELHYQPQAMLADGQVASAEALVRWHHPTRGLIMPDHFIPIAQETGLIGPLTLHILELALRQVRAWRDAGLKIAVSVNLSTRNLLDRELPGRIQELLTRWEVDPAALALEVTESSMMANPKRAKHVLGQLAALGLRLSIDDFGTGYSSLSYLRELPRRRGQDRPLVRDAYAGAGTRRRDRALDDRPRPQPRARRRGRGRGGHRGLGDAARARLPDRPRGTTSAARSRRRRSRSGCRRGWPSVRRSAHSSGRSSRADAPAGVRPRPPEHHPAGSSRILGRPWRGQDDLLAGGNPVQPDAEAVPEGIDAHRDGLG